MDAPEPPDPLETARAQAGMNIDTARAQQGINMVDQVNPWGSVTYDQTGMGGFTDSQGQWVDIPEYTQTTTFSPEQQAIFEQTQSAQGNLAGLASDQSEKMREYLNEPFTFDNQDAANWAYDLGAQRLDPRFERREEALRTRLINQGIRPGSAAYDAEISQLGQNRNDAYNNLMLTGRAQAFQEALSERNQPINELTALLSGSQVSNPAAQSGPAPQTGVGGVDYTGLVNQKYQAELANSQSAMGGLFGLGSALIGALPFSDERLKTDIRRVGETDGGTPIYTYRMKSGGPVQMGVMAQEVPNARVVDPDTGFYRVDYGRVH